ncbi:MAG: hypothetical protein QM330_05600 [Acidobacteriota bacterium]|jgi:hypothetical protein|nr:hypothetical protein [Acidobacteriota bacterium]NLT32311.1 hypothetical protein [Acidobacteriota bacterium]
METSNRILRLLIPALAFAATLTMPAAAQLLPPGAASAETTPVVVSPAQDRFLMLIQPRDLGEIDRDIEMASQLEIAATEAERVAQAGRSASKSRIDEKKQMLSANKDKMKAAKNAKNQSEVLLLESERKALERDKRLHEERESLRAAEIDLARKRAELASRMKQAFDLERQLAVKRGEQSDINVSGPKTARAANVLIDLERATLEMQKKVASSQADVANRAQKVVDRQLKTLTAQQKVFGGR